jgi:hypothetical protein
VDYDTPAAYNVDMKVVRTNRYLKDLKRLKASAADVDEMERQVADNPLSGAVMQGLKGVRKARFRIANRGKSGGGRAIYFYFVAGGTVVMLTAYAKSEKDDLSPEDRKSVLRVLEELKL